jgi:hypothetical protein
MLKMLHNWPARIYRSSNLTSRVDISPLLVAVSDVGLAHGYRCGERGFDLRHLQPGRCLLGQASFPSNDSSDNGETPKMLTKRIWFPLMLLSFGAFAYMATVGKGDGGDTPSRAQIGFKIAPLPLNLKGKDHHLVGYGSYLVNAVGDCNGCHSTREYAEGGNPFLGQPKVIDTTKYLRGGQSFGPFVSRNLRPVLGTGLPAGLTYQQFQSAIRHGTD